MLAAISMASLRRVIAMGAVSLAVSHRAEACSSHWECAGDMYCDDRNVCYTCSMVRGSSWCDAIDNDCSTPCGDTADGDTDMDMTCTAELLSCFFDSECVDIMSACGEDGCEHSLEPLRNNGCCANDACYALHDCMVDSGLVGDQETCADENSWAVLVLLLTLLALTIVAIVACSCLCCSKKQSQQPQQQVIVQQQQPQQQPVVMATPVVQQQAHFNVTVPDGLQPGQSMQVQSPITGMTLMVQVPAGYQPGMSFAVAG